MALDVRNNLRPDVPRLVMLFVLRNQFRVILQIERQALGLHFEFILLKTQTGENRKAHFVERASITLIKPILRIRGSSECCWKRESLA
jgi:hypothetical protein